MHKIFLMKVHVKKTAEYISNRNYYKISLNSFLKQNVFIETRLIYL